MKRLRVLQFALLVFVALAASCRAPVSLSTGITETLAQRQGQVVDVYLGSAAGRSSIRGVVMKVDTDAGLLVLKGTSRGDEESIYYISLFWIQAVAPFQH